MKSKIIKSVALAGLFLTSASLFAQTRFSIGIGIGSPGYYGPDYFDGYGPPPPHAYVAVRPPYPGPGYSWIDGYWHPAGGRYAWRSGYWGLAPYAGGYWVAPRYYGGRYYNGYWGRGDRDGDGIPNRFDRYDNRFRGGRDRDRDGVPDRYDRYDNRRGYGYGYRR